MYRRARSLDALLYDVNARFPGRSKASDGWIGDPSHQSRDSDHNPWVKDGTTGVVTAQDITEDDAPGVPAIADFIVRTLVAKRDPRVKYIIHGGMIWRSYDKPGIPAWSPAKYTGTNAHLKHVHVSVLPEKRFYDDTSPWFPVVAPPKPTVPTGKVYTAIDAVMTRRIRKLRSALRAAKTDAERARVTKALESWLKRRANFRKSFLP